MVRYNNCQVIISTHSPFLLSMHSAKIYDLDSIPATVSKFIDLESMKKYAELFRDRFGTVSGPFRVIWKYDAVAGKTRML